MDSITLTHDNGFCCPFLTTLKMTCAGAGSRGPKSAGLIDIITCPHSLTTDTQLPLTLTTSLHGYPLKKGAWSSEEDARLQDAVKRHGTRNWAKTSEHVRTRNSQSCRNRWYRHLKQEVKDVVNKGCHSLTHSLTHSFIYYIDEDQFMDSITPIHNIVFLLSFYTTLTMTVQVWDRGGRKLQV